MAVIFLGKFVFIKKKDGMKERIIKRFKEKWGDLFDYRDVDYNGYKKKIHIYCKKHDEWFWQTPECHLKFNGCKKCSKELKNGIRSLGNEEFIKRCKKLYGDSFSYDKTEYINNETRVLVTCKKHGDVFVNPTRFMTGSGCPLCNKEKPNKRIKPFEDVLNSFKAAHGDKYSYDESTYVNAITKMRMICPKHGEFWQTPNKHSNKRGCPSCWKERMGASSKLGRDEFIKRATELHRGKYDYSRVSLDRLSDKIEIICPKHGPFEQCASVHLIGCGCQECAKETRIEKEKKKLEDFISEAKKVHGENYSYENVVYVNRNTDVEIICKKHGPFSQKPNKHLRGHGCPKCADSGIPMAKEDFVKRANEIHDCKYDYSELIFTNTKNKVKIICPKHGAFYQEAQSHLSGHGCPKCFGIISASENDLCRYVESLVGEEDIIKNDRKTLDGKEIDILIPNKKIGIEYNGLYWHSEKFGKGKNFHLDKTEEANKMGIKLIQIFEDEWLNKKDIVKSKLKHLLGKNFDCQKIMGRKCSIREIKAHDSFEFLEKNHIQGKAYATIHLGAFYDDRLVGVMLFKKDGKKDGYWELNRFATDINVISQGIGGKLFSCFLKKYNPIEIKSFADRRWTTEPYKNFYTNLGFVLEGTLKPDYHYFLKNNAKIERIHKFNFRKKILSKKYSLPISMTESKMAIEIGAEKIWDCGLYKYVFKTRNYD